MGGGQGAHLCGGLCFGTVLSLPTNGPLSVDLQWGVSLDILVLICPQCLFWTFLMSHSWLLNLLGGGRHTGKFLLQLLRVSFFKWSLRVWIFFCILSVLGQVGGSAASRRWVWLAGNPELGSSLGLPFWSPWAIAGQ